MNETLLKELEILQSDLKLLLDDLFEVYKSEPSAYNNYGYIDFVTEHFVLISKLVANARFVNNYDKITVNNVVDLFKKE